MAIGDNLEGLGIAAGGLATGSRRRAIRTVIPAHNEQGVLGGLLDDLAAQDYRAESLRTVVLAGMNNPGTGTEQLDYWSEFDDLGPGAERDDDRA